MFQFFFPLATGLIYILSILNYLYIRKCFSEMFLYSYKKENGKLNKQIVSKETWEILFGIYLK